MNMVIIDDWSRKSLMHERWNSSFSWPHTHAFYVCIRSGAMMCYSQRLNDCGTAAAITSLRYNKKKKNTIRHGDVARNIINDQQYQATSTNHLCYYWYILLTYKFLGLVDYAASPSIKQIKWKSTIIWYICIYAYIL